MELRIENEIIIPEPIQFNYEELKAELTEKVKLYETLVYTDDQIKQAKADRASLNKLKSALNDERIRRQKEYLAPFEEFKAKIDEIIAIIDKPVSMIDRQIKEFDEKRKEEKRQQIGQLWVSIENRPEWLRLPLIFDERWLNSSVTFRQIQDNMEGWIGRVENELGMLELLPTHSFEAVEVYKTTLDLKKATEEAKRLDELDRKRQEARQETRQNTTEQPSADGSRWIGFSAKLTVKQALELKEFFVTRGIEFRPIGG